MKYYLLKRDEVVGEAVVLSSILVYYCLWESLRLTRECTFEELKKKFKLQPKD